MVYKRLHPYTTHIPRYHMRYSVRMLLCCEMASVIVSWDKLTSLLSHKPL
jgi:hypothetical protein